MKNKQGFYLMLSMILNEQTMPAVLLKKENVTQSINELAAPIPLTLKTLSHDVIKSVRTNH